MKKILTSLVFIATIIASSVNIFADEAVSSSTVIESASYDTATKEVTVTGKVQITNENQNITVMTTGIVNDTYNLDEILFLNQYKEVVLADGSFEVSFKLAEGTNADARYLVRVGGIGTPALMAFSMDGSGGFTVLYGDVNNDGVVNYDDASLLLQYVLDKDNTVVTKNGLKNAQIEKETITEFSAKHASMILQKVLDSGNYVFPAEVEK